MRNCLEVCPWFYSQDMWPSHILGQLAVSYLEVSGSWGNQTLPSSLLREGRKEECHPGLPWLSPTIPDPDSALLVWGASSFLAVSAMDALWHLTMRRDQGVQLYDGFRLPVFPSASIHSWVPLWSPWTSACQAPLSMELTWQECWSGLPYPSPGDLSDPAVEPEFLALQTDSFTTESLGKSW